MTLSCRTGLSTVALACAVALSTTGHGEVLVGFYQFDDIEGGGTTAPQLTLAGVSGSLSNGEGNRNWTSTDLFFGDTTFSTGEPEPVVTDNGAAVIRQTDPGDEVLSITVTNDSVAAGLSLDSLVFDLHAATGGAGVTSIDQLVLAYASGDLDETDGTTIATLTGVDANQPGNVSDYADFSVGVSSVLTDSILGLGESATFTITGSDQNGSPGAADGVPLALDNIAITGTVVPEPASVLLLASGACLLAHRRRKD